MPKQKKSRKTKDELCPRCGAAYDSAVDVVVECPQCGQEGSTACCNTAGRGAACVYCERGDPPPESRD